MDAAPVHDCVQREERRGPRRLDVRDVMRGAREVVLVHGTEEYRLKITGSGKLILTK